MNRRDVLGSLTTGIVVLAGCTRGGAWTTDPENETPTSDDGTASPHTSSGTNSGSPTTETRRQGKDPRETFPDGPKYPPDRPDQLTRESVAAFVHTFEYRYVYNSLWYEESSEVHAECDVEHTKPIDSGYKVVVRCTAYSNTGGEQRENSTGTSTVVHADYFTQTYVYIVTDETLTRTRASMGG